MKTPRKSVHKAAPSTENRILRKIRGMKRGSVFTPATFFDLGSRAAVDQALSRLAKAGTIHRLAKGVYGHLQEHPVLGTLAPAPEKIAKALAGRDRARLQPAGAYAANLLGLSEQVPAKIVFLTDGTSRTVRIGPTTIQLRRTTPRNIAAAGRLGGLLIQALRELGKDNATPERLNRLRQTLPRAKRREVAKDIPLAPAWMHPLLRGFVEDRP